jgi:hypothetical protein
MTTGQPRKYPEDSGRCQWHISSATQCYLCEYSHVHVAITTKIGVLQPGNNAIANRPSWKNWLAISNGSNQHHSSRFDARAWGLSICKP